MTKELVIARYRENIHWIEKYIDIFDRITIYNKGDDITLSWVNNPKINIKKLPNVGRETHTYLYHFYTEYDNLYDRIVCCQGHYEDKISTGEYEELITNNIQINPRPLDMPIDTTIDIKFGGERQKYTHYGEMLTSRLTYKQYCETFFKPMPHQQHEILVTYYGIFSVSREQVHKYSKDAYFTILENSTVSKHINPEDGYYMERLWYYIFNQ